MARVEGFKALKPSNLTVEKHIFGAIKVSKWERFRVMADGDGWLVVVGGGGER